MIKDETRPPKNFLELHRIFKGENAHDSRRPTGLMTKYIGRRYSPEEMWEACTTHMGGMVDDEDKEKISLIRAFEVPSLMGSLFTANFFLNVGSCLQELLMEKIPGIKWDPILINPQLLLKYEIFHVSIPAPVDEITNQLMALEIYGHVSGSFPVDLENILQKLYKTSELTEVETKMLEFNLDCKILQATYANVQYAGIGIPFYM